MLKILHNLNKNITKWLTQKLCHIPLCETAVEISVGCADMIITQELGYRKISAQWIPRHLMPEMMEWRCAVFSLLPTQYELEENTFLKCTVTGNNAYVHFFTPESRLVQNGVVLVPKQPQERCYSPFSGIIMESKPTNSLRYNEMLQNDLNWSKWDAAEWSELIHQMEQNATGLLSSCMATPRQWLTSYASPCHDHTMQQFQNLKLKLL